ncbi:extracellular solute-binding protein [Bradyrhizobium canariense]|uniref:extracellular solute-binding protein n=1 Tax=Bradyrhizobium TaxID=374 RepID=UPI00025D253C|nr:MULTISPECIES: extracellular solute-binding protein [Bradyrhizobium]EIG62231.1 ABC-type sugar transport system, periplasmic component [Bradyrhizobium sp. WSM1253]MBW5434950.1 extracellular solute-binding protein [Bradyrhizobium canariense]
MYDREKNLFESYAAKRISRRDLLDGAAKLGIAGAAANAAFASSVSRAMAADFNWKSQSGKTIKLLLNKHPYVDAMIGDIEAFKSLTGMNLAYDIFPEDVYFDKVTAALSSKSDQYDAFMTGAYMTWTYGPAGWIEDLNTYINDPAKTNPSFAWDDVLPGLRASTAWDGVAGSELGSGKAKQWCIPWGYELNNITYNRNIFDKVGVKPPKNLDEMLEVAAKITKDAGGPYGIGVRGSRSWATIHPGFLSAYSNFGQKDFVMEGGKLKAAMNTKASKDFHEKWVKMIQTSGPKNWSTYTWYQVGTDLGAGASGMIFDADILGYFMNGGENKERGHLGYAPFAANPAAKAPTPNVWIWSLAMSSFSKQKDAAWLFMQWAASTEHDLFGARKMDFVNPVRASVWKDSEFRDRIGKSYPGYLEQHDVSAPGAKIYFTAQPLFFDLTTEWAASLQKMVAKEVSVDEGLDKLADNINRQLKQAGLG